jgi:hypothetical protein
MNWEYDVFISYNWKDEEFVDFLEASLQASGLTCFRDRSGLNLYDKLDASLCPSSEHLAQCAA